MLAHGNAVHADGPHHGAAMLDRFEATILFLSLAAAFTGGSTFVDSRPFVAVTSDGWEQAKDILGVRVNASSVM